jgi:hypothetical protein
MDCQDLVPVKDLAQLNILTKLSFYTIKNLFTGFNFTLTDTFRVLFLTRIVLPVWCSHDTKLFIEFNIGQKLAQWYLLCQLINWIN